MIYEETVAQTLRDKNLDDIDEDLVPNVASLEHYRTRPWVQNSKLNSRVTSDPFSSSQSSSSLNCDKRVVFGNKIQEIPPTDEQVDIPDIYDLVEQPDALHPNANKSTSQHIEDIPISEQGVVVVIDSLMAPKAAAEEKPAEKKLAEEKKSTVAEKAQAEKKPKAGKKLPKKGRAAAGD
ncbi:hypothetical protein LOK49_LG05G01195 [Camellia lanceoleosa]|uniref:Uncharacterized protein n=1 Tax=Camellia lanceoleosa TaxID=1840588 RepID=A0ACC0HIA6_9ERIC|nr:hypothetical protein LOK49_LG05G01195 [Camellia lanceoleosa]